jgi:hypothetical protein
MYAQRYGHKSYDVISKIQCRVCMTDKKCTIIKMIFIASLHILEHERGEEDGKSFEIKNECAQSFSSYVLCFPS